MTEQHYEYRVVGMDHDKGLNRTSATYETGPDLLMEDAYAIVEGIRNTRGGRIERRELGPWRQV